MGLILRALRDDLTVVHMQLVHLQDRLTRDGGDLQLFDAMQIGQRKGKPFSAWRFSQGLFVSMSRYMVPWPEDFSASLLSCVLPSACSMPR